MFRTYVDAVNAQIAKWQFQDEAEREEIRRDLLKIILKINHTGSAKVTDPDDFYRLKEIGVPYDLVISSEELKDFNPELAYTAYFHF